jgi:hypothetical protein
MLKTPGVFDSGRRRNLTGVRIMKNKIFLLPLTSFLFITGCGALVVFGAGTAAGVAGYKWYEGSLTVIYEAPYIKAWDASLKALEKMESSIQSQKHDLTKGTIKAELQDKKSVTISLSYKSAQQTEVVIRVGFFGDKNTSDVIQENIRKELFG